LLNYYEANREISVDENQAFVVGFEPYGGKHFVMVWSTPKLMSIQGRAKFLATDATYKLNWSF
jgi:hypothetical protein